MNREERERQGIIRGKRKKNPKRWFLRITAPNLPWPPYLSYRYLATEVGKLSDKCYLTKADALAQAHLAFSPTYWHCEPVRVRTSKKPVVVANTAHTFSVTIPTLTADTASFAEMIRQLNSLLYPNG